MPSRIRRHYAPGDGPEQRAKRQALHKLRYESLRKNDPFRRFYFTKEWRALRAAFIKKHKYCAVCDEKAAHVDHIKDVRHHWDLRLNPFNLQSLCHSCHSRKTAGFAGYKEFDYGDNT